MFCHREQGFLTQSVIAKHAQLLVRMPVDSVRGDFGTESLELADFRRIFTKRFKLAAVIEGKGQDVGPFALPR